jgi:hypothetical protein
MTKLFLLACLLLSLSACNVQTYESVDGRLPDSLVQYVQPYVGTYRAQNGGTVVLSMNANAPVLTANFDVTGSPCGTKIGLLDRVSFDPTNKNTFDPSAPFDADFDLDVGSCVTLPARVTTFHFNRALGAQNVFELTVELQPEEAGPHGPKPAVVQTWYLTPVVGNSAG